MRMGNHHLRSHISCFIGWSLTAVFLIPLVLLGGCANKPVKTGLEAIGTVTTVAKPKWYDGTIFSYNTKLGVTQCLADMGNCDATERDPEKLLALCISDRRNCQTGNWRNPNWHPERVVFSPDGKHLLVTVCRNEDRQHCTLRRYWIDAERWEDLPGLEADRHYGWGTYDPSGHTIAVATWKCVDLPRREDERAKILKFPQPLGPECGVTEPGLWLLDNQGRRTHSLLRQTQTGQTTSTEGRYQQNPLRGPVLRNLVFSPDGKRLAYWRMQGAMLREKQVFTSWNVYELDLTSGREKLAEAAFWDYPESGPFYLDDGKRLIFSAHNYTRQINDSRIFVADLTLPKPENTLKEYLDSQGQSMAIRDISADGSMALIATFGGGGSRIGSLYLYDLNMGPQFFDTQKQDQLKKIWQEIGAHDNFDAALSRDRTRVALIEGLEMRIVFDHSRKRLWLINDNGQLRHVRLDW
ncbi:MAG: hypothetical protein HXY26_05150 [Hydrogenophilaceae bacterium]|nr:hypothetical protein [Hydrogenophilaceae bacterium]